MGSLLVVKVELHPFSQQSGRAAYVAGSISLRPQNGSEPLTADQLWPLWTVMLRSLALLQPAYRPRRCQWPNGTEAVPSQAPAAQQSSLTTALACERAASQGVSPTPVYQTHTYGQRGLVTMQEGCFGQCKVPVSSDAAVLGYAAQHR